MFESLKSVISARLEPMSPNKANTYYKAIRDLQEYYNSMADQLDSQPGDLFTFNDGTPITIEALNSFSMTVATSVMNGFTQQEQSIVQNCFASARQEIFNLPST